LNRYIKQAAAVLTAAAALISLLGGCTVQPAETPPEATADAQPSASAPVTNAADQMFTVRFHTDYSLNPITGVNPDNIMLVPLMYEGLFILSSDMTPQKLLCEDYSTADGVHYTFKIKSGVAMSDGSTLSANDVKYSLTWAAQKGRFAGRLSDIEAISVNSPLELSITLKAANYQLPSLLDIPIIKSGSIDNNHPPGSGPYTYEASGTPRLIAFTKYRDYDKLPISTIYLRQCSDTELSVIFSSQAVDLFWDDPGDTSATTRSVITPQRSCSSSVSIQKAGSFQTPICGGPSA
jgi:peptide/nickel transport system substrate-binding protein